MNVGRVCDIMPTYRREKKMALHFYTDKTMPFVGKDLVNVFAGIRR